MIQMAHDDQTGELAVKFYRVSSDTQDEANQKAAVDRHFTAHGYVEAREPFTLHDVSASKGEHEKELAEILSDIKAGRYTVVVIANSARIDRRDPDLQEFWSLSVRLAGGRIESASEPEFGKSTLSGRVVTMLAQQANYDYTNTLSTNVKNSFDRIDAIGAIRNRAPYGFRITGPKYDKRFVLDDTEAGIIRECVARYLAGQSMSHICRWLTTGGHRGRNGAAWTPKTLGKTLRSETLIGRYRQGGVVAAVPRVISIKDHRAVVARMDAKAYRKGVRTRPDTALLTSILHCGTCGRPMYRFTGRANQPVVYYCRPRAGVPSCKMLVPLEELERDLPGHLFTAGVTITQEVVIPGHNYDDEIDQIALDIQRLDPLAGDYRRMVDEKLAEIDRLRALPSVPDRTETREIDMSDSDIGREWGRMTPAGRRAALLNAGVRLYARKNADGRVTIATERPSTI